VVVSDDRAFITDVALVYQVFEINHESVLRKANFFVDKGILNLFDHALAAVDVLELWHLRQVNWLAGSVRCLRVLSPKFLLQLSVCLLDEQEIVKVVELHDC
jgi:hypothetical protein